MMEAPTADCFDYIESDPADPKPLKIGVRGRKAMRSLGCDNVESLSQFSEFEVGCVKNVGDATIKELREFLLSRNLAFKADPEYPGERWQAVERIMKLVKRSLSGGIDRVHDAIPQR